MRKLILSLLTILLLMLGGTWYLASSTTGLKLGITLASRFVPGTLTVQEIKGSVFRGFELRGIHYQYPKWHIEAGLPLLTFTRTGLQSNLSGEWQLDIADLSHLTDNTVKGSLQGQGGIHGSLLNPSLAGILTGKALNIAGQNVGHQTAHLMFALRQDLSIRGYLELNTHLESLPPLISPWVKNPSGNLSLAFTLSGLLLHPSVTGMARLTDASLNIPSTGIQLQHINLAARLQSNGDTDFEGNFLAGSGTGHVQGTIQGSTVALNLNGTALQATNLSHWHIVVTPSLKLKITPQQFEASGSIQIPKALITSSDLNNTVTLADDVVLVTAAGIAPTLPFQTNLNLTIELGDDIQIATENLDTRLKGSLHLRQQQSGPVTGTGELTIAKGKNTFKAYGQTLTIQSGRLFFAGGAVSNPGLAITAAKTIQTVNLNQGSSSFTDNTGLQSVYTGRETLTVGVHVTGTLDEPVLSLFSDPPLNQADMLSYLIFGYPRSAISGQQTSVLLTALSALTPGGGSMASGTNITDILQKKLGITELNLETTQFFDPGTSSTVSTTALVVGKKLSDKLSLHYSVSLFYPVSILNLRYQFNKHWALQTENSTIDNGADLLFGIERD